MEAISSTLDLVRTTGKPVYVVLNATTPQGHEAAEAAEALGELDVQVCPVHLVNRVVFARSLITGHTAQEVEPKGKAAREVEQMHAFTHALLHRSTTKRMIYAMTNKFANALKKDVPVAPAALRETPSRRGAKHIGGYFDPEVSRQLRQIAVNEDTSHPELAG